MKMSRPWIVVGNPESRRVHLFQTALVSRGLPPARVVSYRGLLLGTESLNGIPAGVIIRIESPGENFEVEKLMLCAGADAAESEGSPFLSRTDAGKLSDDRGLIRYPRQWFLGFIATLRPLLTRLATQDALLSTSIRDLEILFDKRRCHASCQSAGVPVPECLGLIRNWESLETNMRERNWRRAFVKMAHGSSASGVIALHIADGRYEAITSAELVRSQGQVSLYNSLRIRHYTALEDIRDLIDTLAPHGIHVEQWLPKAAAGHGVCDLRVVVIAGEPQHIVVRASRTPLTNLHLGNRRGNLGAFLERLTRTQVAEFLETCRRCARIFCDSFQIGVDILFTPGLRQHYVLEANAFGDLLPGVLHQGRDTYQAEVDAVSQVPSSTCAIRA